MTLRIVKGEVAVIVNTLKPNVILNGCSTQADACNNISRVIFRLYPELSRMEFNNSPDPYCSNEKQTGSHRWIRSGETILINGYISNRNFNHMRRSHISNVYNVLRNVERDMRISGMKSIYMPVMGDHGFMRFNISELISNIEIIFKDYEVILHATDGFILPEGYEAEIFDPRHVYSNHTHVSPKPTTDSVTERPYVNNNSVGWLNYGERQEHQNKDKPKIEVRRKREIHVPGLSGLKQTMLVHS